MGLTWPALAADSRQGCWTKVEGQRIADSTTNPARAPGSGCPRPLPPRLDPQAPARRRRARTRPGFPSAPRRWPVSGRPRPWQPSAGAARRRRPGRKSSQRASNGLPPGIRRILDALRAREACAVDSEALLEVGEGFGERAGVGRIIARNPSAWSLIGHSGPTGIRQMQVKILKELAYPGRLELPTF